MMIVHVVVILVEQFTGPYPAPNPAMTLAVYGSYLVMPLVALVRLWPERDPFASR